MKHFKRGNHKIPKDIAVFSLPRIKTCPGATPLCKEVCYSLKAERMYKNVLPYREKQLEATKQPEWETEVVAELSRMRGLRAVRIHESGDFYSQEYLDKWVRVAKAMPKLIFFAFTKSWWLDFDQRPNNFVVRLSIDETSPLEALMMTEGFDGVAHLGPYRAHECHYPEGDCRTCDYCLSPGDVWWHKH
jgi:hypothetical protein